MNFAVIAARGVLLLLLAILAFISKIANFIKSAKIEILKLRNRIWRAFGKLLLVEREFRKMIREIWRKPKNAAEIGKNGIGEIFRIFWRKIKRKKKIRTFLKFRSKRAKNRNLRKKNDWLIILIKPTGARKIEEIPENGRSLNSDSEYEDDSSNYESDDEGESYFYKNLRF